MEIFRNPLGLLEPKATIQVFNSNDPSDTKYFALETDSDAPRMAWDYASHDVNQIVAEMESLGWECKVRQDKQGYPVIDLIHKATQAEIDQIDNEFKGAKKCFVRFGKCSKGGKSFNYRDHFYEEGVSVFEAEFNGKEYQLVNMTDRLMIVYYCLKHLPFYRVYGKVVGVGSDGEPLLRVTRIKKISD